ncbi:glutamate receptor 2-like [Polyergus mexicanus]|uniref:glutamate receptor 2-like n=1 Tax=Polyergus mexicanus TaxID=615972 RepID=UPI0038B4F848
MNGVIWNKMKKIFVPISSIPAYAKMQQERFKQNRALENHNFQLQNLTLTSFQEPNFFEFYDNNTKVTGLCGELWILLSESLNFTLQPIRSNINSLGALEENNTYQHGLLGILFHNETIAIPKVETYSKRLVATDFTIPLWINSYRTYIRHEETQYNDSAWMAKVFSWKVWCIILIMHVILSVCGFWSQIILARIEDKCKNTNFGEHFFYNFGMFCNQSYIPDVLHGRSKILEISLSLFCSILYMSFSALLFIYMTKSIIVMPFNNLPSLVTQTAYSVVTLEGSIADIAFKVSPKEDFIKVRTAKRVVLASTVEEMFEMVCLSRRKKYAVFQGEDEYKTRKILCNLTPIGQHYLHIWIASGIVKNFKYKRTIDLGILKLMEVGLWDALVNRWLEKKFQDNNNVKTMDAIGMDQVVLVNAMMCCGAIIAFIILVIEKIVYAYKLKQS